jgi:cysteine-rich repeat protein
MTLRGVWVLAFALVSGCTRSSSVQCGDLICSEVSVCSPSGDACVLPTQLDACKGKNEDDACTFPGVTMGACVASVCTEVVCGNGHTEAITGEVCDDGNRISGDGCSADCKSREMCGDGVVDVFKSEECDCGIDDSVPLPAGCSSTNNDVGGAPCRLDCKRARCGDGIMDPGELCDDGNNTPGDGCRADCEGRWTQMVSNTFADLTDVFAVSDTEAYAVGSSNHVLRWNGSSWARIPGPAALDGNHLYRVWAVNSSAVWVVTAAPTVWHFNGNSWTEIDPRTDQTEGIEWRDISGTGFNDIWLAGSSTEGRGELVAHWNGSWSVFSSTNFDSNIQSVYASPGGPAYVTDVQGHVHTLLTTTPFASPPIGGNADGLVLDGTSPTNVVVFGANGGSHFNGSTWTKLASSDELSSVYAAAAASGPMGTQQIVIGGPGNTMVCDGTTCRAWSADTSSYLRGISAYGYDRAFIVGENGVIFY